MKLVLSVLASVVLASLNGVVCDVEKRQQSDAVKTPELNALRPLQWADVNFLQTTDTHGWLAGHLLEGSYNGDLGDFYSFCVRMKEKARKLRKDLFIVDTGDLEDGSGLSDVTSPKGIASLPLLTKIPYDLLTIGNHELYVNNITTHVVNNFVPHWKDRYLASNVYIKDVNANKTIPIGQKFTYFKGEFGTKVLAYGFLFDFTGNGDNSVVQKVEYEIQQDWFVNSLKKYKPDVITLIGHSGIRFAEFKAVLAAIRAVYPTIPVSILGGHTHVRDFAVYDPYAAGIASGRFLETIGFFSIDGIHQKKKPHHHGQAIQPPTQGNLTFNRRYLDQNRKTFIFHSVNGKERKFDTKIGRSITKNIFELRKKYDLSARLGCAPQNYYLNSVPTNATNSVFSLLTKEVLPKSVGAKNSTNPPFFIINTGGVRYDVYKGSFTTDSMYQVSPFSNIFYAVKDVPIDIAKQLLPKMNKVGELKRRGVVDEDRKVQNLTPGYVTKDDLGTDGDDTTHLAIPFFRQTSYVGSDLPDVAKVDVVYFDFFDNQLRGLLTTLTNKTWPAVTNYAHVDSSTMWIDFAKNHWNSTSC